MSRVEKFSPRARKILSTAQDEAESSHSPTIETPHVLLGILRTPDSVACRVLNDLNVNYDKMLPLVLSAHPGEPTPTKPTIARETKRLIETATDIARQRGDQNVDSEHFLLSLVRGDDKSIRYLMRQINLSPEVVRNCVERVLREDSEDDLPQTKPFNEPKLPFTDGLPDLEAENAPMFMSGISNNDNMRSRVIKLVEDGKISAQEAAELLKAMRLAAVPLSENTGYVLLPLDSISFDEVRQRTIHIVVRDRQSNTVTADVSVNLEQAQNELFRLLRDAYQGMTGSLLEIDGAQGHIAISIE